MYSSLDDGRQQLTWWLLVVLHNLKVPTWLKYQKKYDTKFRNLG